MDQKRNDRVENSPLLHLGRFLTAREAFENGGAPARMALEALRGVDLEKIRQMAISANEMARIESFFEYLTIIKDLDG